VTVHAVIGWRSNELVVDAHGERSRTETAFPAREARRGDRHRLLFDVTHYIKLKIAFMFQAAQGEDFVDRSLASELMPRLYG
jgi:hypothetical protein